MHNAKLKLRPVFSVEIIGPVADESRRVIARDVDIFAAHDAIWSSMYAHSALRVTSRTGAAWSIATFLRMVHNIERAVEVTND
jgi:hypothetical protein